jgi:hypothetical protein
MMSIDSDDDDRVVAEDDSSRAGGGAPASSDDDDADAIRPWRSTDATEARVVSAEADAIAGGTQPPDEVVGGGDLVAGPAFGAAPRPRAVDDCPQTHPGDGGSRAWGTACDTRQHANAPSGNAVDGRAPICSALGPPGGVSESATTEAQLRPTERHVPTKGLLTRGGGSVTGYWHETSCCYICDQPVSVFTQNSCCAVPAHASCVQSFVKCFVCGRDPRQVLELPSDTREDQPPPAARGSCCCCCCPTW